MPLVKIKNINKTVSYGIWHIKENLEFFINNTILSTEEEKIFATLSTEFRKKQWLSYRLIINELLGCTSHIIYNENGAPYLEKRKEFISISHSGEYAVAILSKSAPCGIDIEIISERIHKICEKFMSNKELENIDSKHSTKSKYVHWCTKEALYKMNGEKGVIFKNDFSIHPFSFRSKGSINTVIKYNNHDSFHSVYYEEFNGYMFVFTVKGLLLKND